MATEAMSDQKDFLYKYRAIDENNLDRSQRIFTHNELYFANANQFNDPFDCKSNFSFAASNGEAKSYFDRNLKRKHPNWNRQKKRSWIAERLRMLKERDPDFEENLKQSVAKMISEIGVYSLSRVPDNILMWSHYANSHQGFCLKFFDDETDRFIARRQEILYSENYPIVNPIKDDDRVRLKKTLLTKAKHWEYEKEWRIIDHEEGPGIKRFPPHLLVGVIFGCRMMEEHQGLVREWCKSHRAELSFYKAREAEQTYSLELIKV